MDQATQDEILAQFNEAEQALNSNDVETMNAARSKVDSAAMKIGQAVYNQQSADAGAEQQPEGEQQQEEPQQEEQQQQEGEQTDGEKKN